MNILNNKLKLAFLPTPFHKLNNLSERYKGYNLYIKRDDQTGLASGGNKTRKVEYLLHDAIQKGCDAVITGGAQQSNHCRQTAAGCAQAGIECHLLLGGDEPEVYDGNLYLSKVSGATIHFTGENRKGEDIERVKNELIKEGKKPYVIPYGGSNMIGALGFVNAIIELKQQLDETGVNIDYIFFASSSGGTQAGMYLGKLISGLKSKFMPIFIDKEESEHDLRNLIYDIIQEGRGILNVEKDIEKHQLNIIRGYDDAGYGVVTNNERYAIKTMGRLEGIILDPVYTGRAFYGMLDHLEKKLIPEGSNVMYWHTGGLPANFYYADKMF
jgi:D-cysteine desulfhydrase family pyridoxal phosphate-dependent enzyme